MASLVRIKPPRARLIGGGDAPIREYPCSSQTLKAGQAVALDANGLVVTAIAAGNDFGAGTKLLGILNHDVDSSMTKCHVIIARPDVEFELPVYHATAASAVTAQNQVGDKHDVIFTSGSVLAVKIDTTANTKAMINQISTRYPTGEQYGTVWASFLEAACQLEAGV